MSALRDGWASWCRWRLPAAVVAMRGLAADQPDPALVSVTTVSVAVALVLLVTGALTPTP